MSGVTSPLSGEPPSGVEDAVTSAQQARSSAEKAYLEAHGSHRNTRRILAFLQRGGSGQEDPLGAMLEAQDAMLERQERILELLGEIRTQIGQLRSR